MLLFKRLLMWGRLSTFSLLFLLTFLFPKIGNASITPRYNNNNISGGITFTGNTLGLAKRASQNNPGLVNSIGAYIEIPPPLVGVGTYPNDTRALPPAAPAGTTLTWQNNSSAAYLDLPPGSTVLYAELVWAGSYGFGGETPLNTVNSNVTFITPDAVSHSIPLDPTTASSVVFSGTTGFYLRSNAIDVTPLVAANGAGYYITGGVAGTTVAADAGVNCAGWVLTVAYHNPSMNTKSLSIWVDLQFIRNGGTAPVFALTGFCTPSSGPLTGLLFSSALEGDISNSGDQLLFSTTVNPPTTPVSGINNPVNNFFCSQINTLVNYSTDVNGKIVASPALLDTRGSYGLFNGNAITKTSLSGQRQGFDITSVDVSSMLGHSQNTAYILLKTSNDAYCTLAQGLDIQTNAPIIQVSQLVNGSTSVSVPTSIIPLTFTFTINNPGTQNATSVVFTEVLPGGLTFVPNSFQINAVPQIGADPNVGVPIPGGLIAGGSPTTVQFDALPTLVGNYTPSALISYVYVPCGSGAAAGEGASNTVQIFVENGPSPPPVAVDDFATTTADVTLVSGSSVLINDTGNGILVTSINTGLTLGSVAMNTTANPLTNGFYVYTPPSNFSGNDSFSYTITDVNSATASATVHITVLPQAVSDGFYTTTKNTPIINAATVLTNDLGTGLSIFSYDFITTQGGIITMPSAAPGSVPGSFDYTPPLNYIGPDSFNYVIQDFPNMNQSTATVTLEVLSAGPISGPTNFVGVLKKCTFLKKAEYTLRATWSPSPSFGIVSYRIYLAGSLVAVVPASGPFVYKACLSSKQQARLYTIVAVDLNGTQSLPVPIVILE